MLLAIEPELRLLYRLARDDEEDEVVQSVPQIPVRFQVPLHVQIRKE